MIKKKINRIKKINNKKKSMKLVMRMIQIKVMIRVKKKIRKNLKRKIALNLILKKIIRTDISLLNKFSITKLFINQLRTIQDSLE